MTKTGTKGHAQSSSDVLVEIRGAERTSGQLRITDKLKKGRTQTFTFPTIQDLGPIKGLRLEILGGDGWLGETVTVRNLGTEEEQIFYVNKDLDTDGNSQVYDSMSCKFF